MQPERDPSAGCGIVPGESIGVAERTAPPSAPKAGKWLGPMIGAVLCVPSSYATANLPQSSMFSLLAAPVGLLIALALANQAFRFVSKRNGLAPRDFAIVFAMISAAGAISAEWTFFMHGTAHHLPFLAQGNPVVRDQILANLPEWLVVHDAADVQDMQSAGQGASYVLSKWPVFLARYTVWGVLIGSVALACLCVNSLLRQAWVHTERLAFPIVQLPLAISGGNPPNFWRSRALWFAFAIVFAIDMLNGFQYLYPSLPKIAIKQVVDVSDLIAKAPWHSMGELNIGIYPFLAAIGLLIPSDLLASVLIFFALRKATHVLLGMFGVGQSAFSGTYFAPGAPWFEQQAWGAVLALFVSAVYFGRSHFVQIYSEIRTGQAAQDGGWTSRGAFLGLVACSLVVVAFGWVGSISPATMFVYFLLFLVFSVVLARLRAQLGPPTHEFAYFGPMGIMGSFAGNQWMGEKQAVWFSHVFFFMNRIARTHPGPTQLEAMKLGESTGASMRTILWSIVLATVLGFFLAYGFYLTKAYRLGAPVGAADTIGYYTGLRQTPAGPDAAGIGMVGFGFGLASILETLRMRLSGFWLHPAGYLLGISYGIDYYWFGLLLALLAKMFIVRFRGAGGYERLKQVAIGIMLAEYTAEAIWMATALVTKQSTYTIGFNDRSLGIQ